MWAIKKLIRWLWRLLGCGDGPNGHVPKEVNMCETFNPDDLLEQVKNALVEMDWRFGQDPQRPALLMGWGGKNGIYSCFLQVLPDRPLILFYSHVQCRVPEEKRATMAEFLTRANDGLWLGNFELDFADGAVCYRTSLYVGDGLLTTDMLSGLLHANLSTMDRFMPGVMSVLWNDVSAEDAMGLLRQAA
jgi:hypothetical protein